VLYTTHINRFRPSSSLNPLPDNAVEAVLELFLKVVSKEMGTKKLRED
jgi:hypothetical protein